MKTILHKSHLIILAISCCFLLACEEDPVGPTIPDNLVSLNYDAENFDAPSLPANSYEAGVRFPASQMSTYAGDRMTEVNFWIQELPQACELRIYTGSDGDNPDSLVYSANIRGELRAASWNKHELSTPLELAAEDLWLTLAFSHSGQQRTVGCDPGPAVNNGDWLLDDADGLWIPLNQRAPININWNIRGAIEPQ